MNTSDTVLAHPVELTGSDLDAVSAGLARAVSPIVALEDDIKSLVRTILSDVASDLGGGRGMIAR
jgi:hypothetical protein